MSDFSMQLSPWAMSRARIALRRGATLTDYIPACRCFAIDADRQMPPCSGGVCEETTEHVARAIVAARRAALEEAAALVEQVAKDDDYSVIGEKAADAFNGGRAHRSMNSRLIDWNREIVIAIRALASPQPAAPGEGRK